MFERFDEISPLRLAHCRASLGKRLSARWIANPRPRRMDACPRRQFGLFIMGSGMAGEVDDDSARKDAFLKDLETRRSAP